MLPGSDAAVQRLEGFGSPAGATVYKTADNAEISDSRRAFVTEICQQVAAAKGHWKPVFDQMICDQRFAQGKQWEALHPDLKSRYFYTVNIVLRHIQQRVSALYAKNPRFVARRRDRIDYTVWDGRPDTIDRVNESLLLAEQTGIIDPNAMAIYEDFIRVAQQREMFDRVAKTLEIAFSYYIDEQVLPFKKQMKRIVRRAITTGVGFVKIDFQRVMQLRPETQQRISDYSQRLATIERLTREMAEGQQRPDSAEAEQLRLMIAELQREEQIIVREGLVIDYPSSTAIIPDTRCVNLDGFVGCEWVAQEYLLTPAEIKEVYDVDVSASYAPYTIKDAGLKTYGRAPDEARTASGSVALVYEVYNRKHGLVYTVCDGFPDFLTEPRAPNVRLERFWPFFALMFNEVDSEECVYPPSDVQLLWHQQLDYNRARQGLREHRQAARPKTLVAAGRLSEEDKEKLRDHPANAVLELQGLQPGEKVEDMLQPFKGPPIDPALYDTTPQFEDTLRAVGTQEANLGGTSAATATESSIAESSRLSSLQSAVDDLDELLTEIARAGGQILLAECSERTIQRIVGAGAVWPQMSRAEIAEELYLDVEAGSSGRPNQAAQIQNAERMAPFLLQVPGIRPTWLATQLLHRMDDNLDLSEAFDPALPSITAMNSQKQVALGPPSQDPNAQGAEGAQNTPQPVESEGDQGRPGRPPMDPNLDLPEQSGIAVN